MMIEDLVVSCCANPEKSLDAVLSEYSQLGYRRVECFCDWVESALDYHCDAGHYLLKAKPAGMQFFALHLPHFNSDAFEYSLQNAIDTARFAAALGMKVVYPRATSREAFMQAGKPFLDAIEETGLTAAIEIHKGFPVHNLATLREVLDAIGDPRMKAVLEVGHLHHAGETWQQAWHQFGERLAVVHLKDIEMGRNVPLGAGEIDLAGMLKHLRHENFQGDLVVELLLDDRESTQHHLCEARRFVEKHWS